MWPLTLRNQSHRRLIYAYLKKGHAILLWPLQLLLNIYQELLLDYEDSKRAYEECFFRVVKAFRRCVQKPCRKIHHSLSTAHISPRLSRHSNHRCIEKGKWCSSGTKQIRWSPSYSFHLTHHPELGGTQLWRARCRTPSYRGHIKSVEMLPTLT